MGAFGIITSLSTEEVLHTGVAIPEVEVQIAVFGAPPGTQGSSDPCGYFLGHHGSPPIFELHRKFSVQPQLPRLLELKTPQ
jgi:hypothetical protein